MKNSTNLLQGHLCKQWTIYFISIISLLTVLCLSFISCAPPEGAKIDSETDDVVEDVHDKEEGCRGYEQCEDICEDIYDESWEACSRESSGTVTRLQKVFNRLKSSRASRTKFDEISEEDGGITLDDFKKYLEIGVDGWIEQIEEDSSNKYENGAAKEAILWLAEEGSVAEILANLTEDGSDVLEALLEKANLPSCFFGSNPAGEYEVGGELKLRMGGSQLQVITIGGAFADPDIEVEIDNSRDKRLYELLSCRTDVNVDVDGDDNPDNDPDVFSLAADEDNEHLFNLAFDLLDEVCQESNLDSRQAERIAICRRVMMCVLAINYHGSGTASRDDIETWDGWDYAQDRFDIGGFDEDEACDIDDRRFGGNIRLN